MASRLCLFRCDERGWQPCPSPTRSDPGGWDAGSSDAGGGVSAVRVLPSFACELVYLTPRLAHDALAVGVVPSMSMESTRTRLRTPSLWRNPFQEPRACLPIALSGSLHLRDKLPLHVRLFPPALA